MKKVKEKDTRKTALVDMLSFSGKMKKVAIRINGDFPKEALKVDSWFSPQIGELCLNSNNELDIVKDIKFRPSDGVLKAANMYSLESGETCSQGLICRVEVKRGKVFIFKGRIFVHQEPLVVSYIDKIARGESITKYESGDFE